MMKVVMSLCVVSALVHTDCNDITEKYAIDPRMKSVRGWKRVIHRGVLQRYTERVISPVDKSNLKSCLVQEGYDINKYDRFIGSKVK